MPGSVKGPTVITNCMNRGKPVLKDWQQGLLNKAFEQAQKSFDEGGLPIGAALAKGEELIAVGHNRRFQDGDPIAHGEMDCFRQAGRRRDYQDLTLYTTLSPCMMCAGTIIQFGIPRVVIGEDKNFPGNADVATGDILQARDHAQQGRLAATGRPQETDEFTLEDVERDVFQRREVAEHLG